MTASKSISVFLLDDHDMVRKSVAGLLDAEPDIEVVGQSATAAGALPAVASSHPRVAVLDVRLQDGNGIEVCREIRSTHPEVRCLMLTSFSDDRAIVDAALAGADGVILKQIRDNDIVRSIRDVASGMTLLDDATVSASMQRLLAAEAHSIASLTTRESKIFDLIGRGRTNAEIADAMDAGLGVVREEIAVMLRKLGMVRRTEASGAFRRRRHPDSETNGTPVQDLRH